MWTQPLRCTKNFCFLLSNSLYILTHKTKHTQWMIALYITLHLQHHNLFFFARKTLSSCFIPSSFVNNAKQMHLSFIVGHIPLGDVQIYCMKFINMFKNQKKSSSISSFFFVSFVCTAVVSYFPLLFLWNTTLIFK